jgi:hypothetical protein
MDPTIIAAIIAGGCTIIAAVIAALLQKKWKKEEPSEKPQKNITVEGDAAVGDQARKIKQTADETYIEKTEGSVVITQPPPTTQEKPTLPAEIPSPPTPYFAHPYPLQANFTGRVKEREELTNWFKNDHQPMFAYIAIGGMGKSALTWYWLQEDIIKKGLAPQGIIWWYFMTEKQDLNPFWQRLSNMQARVRSTLKR